MSESIVLCEGYHDRAFWAAWLELLGCTDPGKQKCGGGRKDVLDPWGNKVVGGQYAFHSISGRFVRIIPCNGRTLKGDRLLYHNKVACPPLSFIPLCLCLAGWYAEAGCEAFYRQVWQDACVVKELEPRLQGCGAWRIARALAE